MGDANEREEKEIDQIAALFRHLGADDRQAATMARQLSKRADQLVEEKGLDRLQALRHLLDLVKSGREGNPLDPLP